MGIKDKVLDILFDGDEEEAAKRPSASSNLDKRKYSTNSLLDTSSIFIDATSPLPKEKKRFEAEEQNFDSYETNQHIDTSNGKDYRLSDNISPIFGPIDNKGKVKNKNILKAKKIAETTSKNFDNLSKNPASSYSNIVISPIFGPIPLKTNKKSVKPKKKNVDEFDRDINDTGSFDKVLSAENEAEEVAPVFEEISEQTSITEQRDPLMDTDKLARISDRINMIKNQAANIYDDNSSDEQEETDEVIEDVHTQYVPENEDHANISDVIHSLKNYDGRYSDVSSSSQNIDQIQEKMNNNEQDYSANITENSVNDSLQDKTNNDEMSVEKTTIGTDIDVISNQTSIDDIFDGEDEVEENKDLFSVLFGDD